MSKLPELFANNRAWAEGVVRLKPDFFRQLSGQQNPKYLWIGCADSRVPANEIIGLMPGEVFVHRNVANVVVHTDLNCLSVLQYAVDVLKVEHVIVCGHYGCGGVQAAYGDASLGLIDNWLRHVKDVKEKYEADIANRPTQETRLDRLCELNVIRQVRNVASDVFVQEAWAREQPLHVHGWIYSIANGLVNDLNVTVTGPADIERLYQA